MKNDYACLTRVHLTSEILAKTGGFLAKAGRQHAEAIALWAGVFEAGERFRVRSAIFPKQHRIRSHHGVGVHMDGQGIFAVNRWLFDNKQVLVAQVHSHPGEAFHSDTDDIFPLVTVVGQFSVVVPNFALAPLTDLSRCAVFRLIGQGAWNAVTPAEIARIFMVD